MPGRLSPSRTAAAVALAVALAGLADVAASDRLSSPQGADVPAYLRIATTVLSKGSFELAPPSTEAEAYGMGAGDVYASQWALTVDGRLFPKHPLLFGLVLTPGVALGGIAGARVTALLLGGLLAGIATWAAARSFGPIAAALAAAAVFLASPGARNVLWAPNVDTLIALVWLSSLVLAGRGRLASSGLLAGTLFFLRPTAPILLAGLVPLLARRPRRELLRFGEGIAPPLLLLASLNTLWWGAPWRSAYDRTALLVAGRWQPGRVSGTFHANPAEGLRILFLHRDGGLLATVPVAIVALVGFAFLTRGRRLALAAPLAGLAAYLVLAPYEHLRVVPEVAYRFATPFFSAAVLPLAALLAAALGALFSKGERLAPAPGPPGSPSSAESSPDP